MDRENESISELILECYKNSSRLSEHDYQAWSLKRLQSIVAFDAAQWADGSIDQHGRPIVHKVYLHNLPIDTSEQYGEMHHQQKIQDDFAVTLTQHPGKTFCWRDFKGCDSSLWDHEIYRNFAAHYNIEHIMSTAVPLEGNNFFSFISLYRSNRDKPFTDKEKEIKQSISKHFIESYRICVQFNLFSEAVSDANKSIGLVTHYGAIFYKMDNFIEACNKIADQEITNNTITDRKLLRIITSAKPRLHRKNILLSKKMLNGLFLVTIHCDPSLQQLTVRETEALIFSRTGLTYEEIAERMGIAKDTVSQHLRNIREKLGVNNIRKIQLPEEILQVLPASTAGPTQKSDS